MPFDTTDVAAQVRAPNAFAQLGDMANTINALNQNKLFRAKQLSGQYLTQATGPDGKVDPGKLNQFLMNDPRTAPFAADIEAAALQNTGQAIQNLTGAQGLAARQYAAAQGIIAQSPKGGEAAALGAAADAGLFPRATAADVVGGNVQGLGPQDWDRIRGAATLAVGNQAEINANIGEPVQITTGPTVSTFQRKTGPAGVSQEPATGSAATVQLGNAPATQSQLINVVNPDGSTTAHTFGEFFNSDNTPKGPVPPVTNIANLDRATQSALGAAYAPQIADFETRIVPQAAQQQQTIANLRQEAAKFTPGPLASMETQWGETLQQLGLPVPDWSQFGNNQTAAREEFHKNITLLLSQQQATLHMDQTDAARQTAAMAVPGNYTSPEGMKKIFGILEANADMISAAGRAWGTPNTGYKAKSGPQSFGEFSMEFPQRLPPLVFQSQYMTRAELKEQQRGWSQAKINDFNARVAAAKKNGWLPNAQ